MEWNGMAWALAAAWRSGHSKEDEHHTTFDHKGLCYIQGSIESGAYNEEYYLHEKNHIPSRGFKEVLSKSKSNATPTLPIPKPNHPTNKAYA